MAGEIIVLVTSSSDQSGLLARQLVEESLAACVNIIPSITSVYVWKGRLEEEGESLLIIKSRSDKFEELKNRVVELHSYDCPEVICLSIQDGYKPYLDWLNSAMAGENSTTGT